MNIDKFKQEDGSYIGADGCWHETAEDFIEHMLDFCGCGRPEDAVEYVGKALNLIKKREDLDTKEYLIKEKELFPIDGSNYFMYYYLDTLEMTDHGGSVPGWLSPKGTMILEDIKEIYNLKFS